MGVPKIVPKLSIIMGGPKIVPKIDRSVLMYDQRGKEKANEPT